MNNLQNKYTKADLDEIAKKEERRRELELQNEIKIIVNSIIYIVLQDAKTKKKTTLTYSKHQLFQQIINDVVAQLKQRFPDSKVTLEAEDHKYTITVDWS